jgi:hypothetical protein
VLKVVPYHEGNFGGRALGHAVIAPHGDEFITVFDYESQSVDVVDLGEVPHLLGRKHRMHRKIATVDGVKGELGVKSH